MAQTRLSTNGYLGHTRERAESPPEYQLLIQGCKCKTGCNSKRCKCTKTGLQCGPSCQCANCKNIKSFSPAKETEGELHEEIWQQMRDDRNEDGLEDEFEGDFSSDGETDSDTDLLNKEVDDVMEEVFGIPF